MIIASLATYPPREQYLSDIVRDIAPQVDQLNIVLNEYTHIPQACLASPKVNVIQPERDTKDTGKFLQTVAPDDWLVTIDDDLFYPPDYVAQSIENLERLGRTGLVGGYHGSIYVRHRYLQSRLIRRLLGRNPNFIVGSRKILGYTRHQKDAIAVDQLGTGTTIMRGCDAPPFDAVAHAQKYVDVGAARYWFETGRTPVSLPREENWIGKRDIGEDESIITTFTSHSPKDVADEIYMFAFKGAQTGEVLSPRTS